MSDLTTVPDLLEQAAEVIDERGWHRGHYTDSDGRCVCLVGAVSIAAGLRPDALGFPDGAPDKTRVAIAQTAVRAVERWLSVDDATDWNDDDAEDVNQVVDELRACAAAERGRTA